MFKEYGITLRDAEAVGYQQESVFTHNEYLQMLADYGWVGLILVGFLILVHLANGLRFVNWFVNWRFGEASEIQSDSLGLAVGCLAAFVAALVQACFEFQFHLGAIMVTAAVVCGILMNPGFNAKSHSPLRIPGVRLVSKLALILGGGALVGATVRWAPADYAASQADLAAVRKDQEGEIVWLSRAVEGDPANPEVHYRRGLARLKGGVNPLSLEGKEALAAAADDLQRAVDLNRWHYLYPVALTDVLDAQQRKTEALAAAKLAVLAAPWHEEARLALAMHYTRSGEFADAERAFLWARNAPARNRPDEISSDEVYSGMLKLAQSVAVKAER